MQAAEFRSVSPLFTPCDVKRVHVVEHSVAGPPSCNRRLHASEVLAQGLPPRRRSMPPSAGAMGHPGAELLFEGAGPAFLPPGALWLVPYLPSLLSLRCTQSLCYHAFANAGSSADFVAQLLDLWLSQIAGNN